MKSAVILQIFMLCIITVNCQLMDDMQVFDEECLGENKFECMSGGCIDWDNWCDGNQDCDDGSDENFCLKHKPDDVLCNATHQYMCLDKERCIPHEWICNNEKDCFDGSDEANCTSLKAGDNSTCRNGFKCPSDGKCISPVWVCDGREDCNDGSDETVDTCRHSHLSHLIHEGSYCDEYLDLFNLTEKTYRCIDSSYCLPQKFMCDGIPDCRDGSDEGVICTNWHTQCKNFTCLSNATCAPDRGGVAICICPAVDSRYNYETDTCEYHDECLADRPKCSQRCENVERKYTCVCEEGYESDEFQHLCFAKGDEALLFISTTNEILYYRVKTNVTTVVATGIKKAHGVAYDGSYVYWVDQAKGYQSISRAHLEDVNGTREVLLSLGIDDPGDIAIDHLGGNFFFSDTERGMVYVCRKDGSACAALNVRAKNPKYLTLDAVNGIIYWADWRFSPVILKASVAGNGNKVLVDNLSNFATGLALDAPGNRLYFVDKKIKAVRLDTGVVYALLDESYHPYSLSVFEHLIYFDEWTTNSIQTLNKMAGRTVRRELFQLDAHVTGLHMYHPVLQKPVAHNPCHEHNCSHICLVTSNVTSTCMCPVGMRIDRYGGFCRDVENTLYQYLIIGSGYTFTRLAYSTLSSLHAESASINVGNAQAITMDYNNTLYIYDTKRRFIHFIHLEEFSLGIPNVIVYGGLRDVVDLAYDFVSNSLYWLDAGLRSIGVMYLDNQERTTLYKFGDGETPLSFCVVPQYGKLIVAVMGDDQDSAVHIDSIGLDGEGREHLIMNNIKGPRVTVRYAYSVNQVYISDDGHGTIDVMHPSGSGRVTYLHATAPIYSMSIAESYVFWTEARSSKLYWSHVHEATPRVRQMELSVFPKNAHLLLTSTLPTIAENNPLLNHPCQNKTTCAYICTQSSHVYPTNKNYSHQYRCLCPPALKKGDSECAKRAECGKNQFYCHRSNVCFESRELCDGKRDCPHGEDEIACDKLENIICGLNEKLCWGDCVDKFENCRNKENGTVVTCESNEFKCPNQTLCLDRSKICDAHSDCLDGSDEADCGMDNCLDEEFRCDSGSCILNSWRCDGEADCTDSSDELNCFTKSCAVGLFQCGNGECIDLSGRCDGQPDCKDKSDEMDCIETSSESSPATVCEAWEHACELNKSICLPLTARCNGRADCPNGTDELDCDACSQHGLFQCKTTLNCVTRHVLCDGVKHCTDGSDETVEACEKAQRRPHHFETPYLASECREGFLCGTGECLEWRQVCDYQPNCNDKSDEGTLCSVTCRNKTCSQACRSTPRGPQCTCHAGYEMVDASCRDVDECARDVCAQACHNAPGSYRCACHRGYALRSDRHSCKATTGNMTVLYVTFNSVHSISSDGHTGVEYHNPSHARIQDIDYDVRRHTLYIVVPSAGKLIETSNDSSSVVVTNVGSPARVTVDWITGNVYFVDDSRHDSWMRVCHVGRRACAKLQRLPDGARVTALTIDPASRRLFYCISVELESAVVTSSLSGDSVSTVTTAVNCSGLAVDSYLRRLYVAQNTAIFRIGYEGKDEKAIISRDPNFESPTGLSLFEDHIYFLVANSYKLNRCLLYGNKRCEPFYWRLFQANTFVIKHSSVQRDDVVNHCEDFVCNNVCVLGEYGPVCVCNDGTIVKDGVCGDVEQILLPLFNGWPRSRYGSSNRVVLSLVICAVVLTTLYLAIFSYYRCVRRRRHDASYLAVHFQNAPSLALEGEAEGLPSPGVDFGSAATSSGFFNPVPDPKQFFRRTWARFSGRKPVGTAGLKIDVPTPPSTATSTPQEMSSTESAMVLL